MAQMTALNGKTVTAPRQAPFTSARRPARQQLRSAVRASKDAKTETSSQAPSDLVLKTVSAFAAAQLAFLPAAGPALAGQAPIKAAAEVGEAVQGKVPEGAANPKTREQRNSGRDQGLSAKLDKIKERANPDNIVNNPASGGTQNIFGSVPGLVAGGGPVKPDEAVRSAASNTTGVAFDSLAAPSLQVNAAFDPANKASEAVDKVKDAAPGGNPLERLTDKIKDAAVTNDSPQAQLDKAGSKAQQAASKVKNERNVSFAPSSSLLHYVGLGNDAGDRKAAETTQDKDMSNASFQGPAGNEGGITQPTMRSGLGGNPKRGGDLKDSGTEFAAQNKGGRDKGTPGQTGADARPGANTPKGVGEIRNPKTPVLPNALGGKNFLRDDSETPEQTASGNIAKAQQSSGNAIDSVKKGLGL